MNRPIWSKVCNVIAYVIIQSTFGILYFTLDVCTKVDKEGHPMNNLTNTYQTKFDRNNNRGGDKFVSSQSLYLSSSTSNSVCAKLQNGTEKFENSVYFSKLEDVEWVRTCMISVMGVVAFLVSNVSFANCLQPHTRFRCTNSSVPFCMPLRSSSIISHKILLFIGCALVLCGTFVSAITVKKSLLLFILT
jgi:hypothetical protein